MVKIAELIAEICAAIALGVCLGQHHFVGPMHSSVTERVLAASVFVLAYLPIGALVWRRLLITIPKWTSIRLIYLTGLNAFLSLVLACAIAGELQIVHRTGGNTKELEAEFAGAGIPHEMHRIWIENRVQHLESIQVLSVVACIAQCLLYKRSFMLLKAGASYSQK